MIIIAACLPHWPHSESAPPPAAAAAARVGRLIIIRRDRHGRDPTCGPAAAATGSLSLASATSRFWAAGSDLSSDGPLAQWHELRDMCTVTDNRLIRMIGNHDG